MLNPNQYYGYLRQRELTLKRGFSHDVTCSTAEPVEFKVARLDFLGGIPSKFEH